MSIKIQWEDEEHTLLRWDVMGSWDWNDFIAAQKQSNDLINSVTHTVDVIVDVSRNQRVPPGAIGRFRTYRRDDPENTGRVVLVGANIYIKTMVEIFRGMFPNTGGQFTFASSLDEARSALNT